MKVSVTLQAIRSRKLAKIVVEAGYDEADIMTWIVLSPPYHWKKYGLVVIADRHLPNGRRQHVVQGAVPPGTVIANADIFGEEVLKC